jgi:hypothetical protein
MDEDEAVERVDARVEDAQDVIERHGQVFRWMWVGVGVVVVGSGLAMIVFPGPVTIVVPAGLVMLAAVFGWARRLLRVTVAKGMEAEQAFEDADRWVQILGYVASACVAAAVIAFVVL